MKNRCLLLIFSGMPIFLSAQMVKRLNDPFIVAQEKRQVYEKWGDFMPYPKYFLGIQTNWAYSSTWGWWQAPKRNPEYKNGPDIRPLRLGGEETIRMAKAQVMKTQAELIKESIDSIKQRSMSDMAHWTNLTSQADPLYLLYYKRMLDPLKNMPENPNNAKDWGFESYDAYEIAKSTGQIKMLQEELDILKDTYKKAMTLDMPRGKRFLMYHKALIGWRNFERTIKELGIQTEIYSRYKQKINDYQEATHPERNRTDKEIAQDIMQRFKHKY
ncbi:MAG: hypothetical protein Q4G08_09740 [Capnocytophaga sp.]|nr:hypothetical protein [Capnocytophaga sp.]